MKSTRFLLMVVLCVCCWHQARSEESYWYHLPGPGTGNRVQSLAVNPRGDVYAGTWNGGLVFRSTDNGETWAQCGAIPNTNPVMWMAVNAQGHVFASVTLRGVYRSTDDGASWQLKSNGLTNLTVRGNVVDRSGFVWVTTDQGLFRSTDNGESWTLKKGGGFGTVYIDSTGAVVASDAAGLHRTTDAGSTWTDRVMPGGFGLGGIHPDGAYWACNTSSAIMRSTDLGLSWTDMHSPVSWSWYTAAFTFNSRGDIFYSQDGDASGVLVSTDNGGTWAVVNDGLTTTRIIPMLHHPNGYVFLGTNGQGIFRSRRSTERNEPVAVSMPDTLVTRGKTIEVPVNVSSVTGRGIFSYEFTVTVNSPDSILTSWSEIVTARTLSGGSDWIAVVNSPTPNRVTVAASGATPLVGSGTLLKLKFTVNEAADSGTSSTLAFSNFLFNTGVPAAATTNGRITVREPVCGDADENRLVQAYDAALALREAIGPMPAPPGPLTAQGRLNADVDMDGKVEAYDAALILRHITGLAIPAGVSTCFGSGPDTTRTLPPAAQLTASLAGVREEGSRICVDVKFGGFQSGGGVVAVSFEVVTRLGEDLSTAVTVGALPDGYISMMNRMDGGHFKVAVVNPNGMKPEDLKLTVASDRGDLLNDIGINGILLNNLPAADQVIAGALTGVTPERPSSPAAYALVGSYPNPFNPSTRIVFEIPEAGAVTLEIFNALGVRVATLVNQVMNGGRHEVAWDGTRDGGQKVASGQYFCRMKAGSNLSTIKLVILK